jgi:hypothetical protein
MEIRDVKLRVNACPISRFADAWGVARAASALSVTDARNTPSCGRILKREFDHELALSIRVELQCGKR